jgi:hypothetical protein
MADYYPLIFRAVSQLASNTAEARQALYERARTVFNAKVQGPDSSLSETEIKRARAVLETAIRRVETEQSQIDTAPPAGEDIEIPRPDKLANVDLEVARKAGPTPAQPEEISTRKKEAAKTTKYLGGTVKSFGGILLGIAFVVGITLAAAFYIRGLAWVSEHVIEYLIPTVVIAIMLCLFILLPLAMFRTTRTVSAGGFVVASYLFGITTWILGFLTTLHFWSGLGVVIGLLLGIIGIVPLGIIASAFHSDWETVLGLIIGLFVTYGSRALGLWLEAKC